jgi:imidazole glycerol-phosphate synthase subunit HisH
VKVTVADLGIGNIHSLAKALEKAGGQVTVSARSDDWLDASVLVLPGVGAFGAGMKPLRPVHDALHAKMLSGAPTLGVCLGMQLLFERSDEDPVEGLGFVRGDVKRFPETVGKIPHMGWSRIRPTKDPLFEGLGAEPYYYFVHSYYPDPEEEVGIAETRYGISFTSVVRKANTYGTQFHPEKSGDAGIKLLANFLRFAEEYA